jgi:hypothetical protein
LFCLGLVWLLLFLLVNITYFAHVSLLLTFLSCSFPSPLLLPRFALRCAALRCAALCGAPTSFFARRSSTGAIHLAVSASSGGGGVSSGGGSGMGGRPRVVVGVEDGVGGPIG